MAEIGVLGVIPEEINDYMFLCWKKELSCKRNTSLLLWCYKWGWVVVVFSS